MGHILILLIRFQPFVQITLEAKLVLVLVTDDGFLVFSFACSISNKLSWSGGSTGLRPQYVHTPYLGCFSFD